MTLRTLTEFSKANYGFSYSRHHRKKELVKIYGKKRIQAN
jgi:hypothetical protein